jgi:acetate CoA/acetoacetate CoA-transferase alpha subunit
LARPGAWWTRSCARTSATSRIANNTAKPGKGIGKLVAAKLVRKVIASHIDLNPETQRQMMASELDLQLVPQGTRADPRRRFRPGLYLDADRHRHAAPRRKATRVVDGKDFLVETALRADSPWCRHSIADYLGNLGYALTARNFNPGIAMAAAR